MARHTLRLRARWSDADPAGIVFYPRFFEWFDTATDALFGALGMPWETLFKERGVVGLPIVDVHGSFTSPVRYADEVTIETRVSNVHERTLRVEHEVRVGERVCATGYEVRAWVAVGENGRLAAQPFPDDVAARLRGAPA